MNGSEMYFLEILILFVLSDTADCYRAYRGTHVLAACFQNRQSKKQNKTKSA